jgi:hypothetical protein
MIQLLASYFFALSSVIIIIIIIIFYYYYYCLLSVISRIQLKKIKICGEPRDSVKIRSSSWSAEVSPGLLYTKGLNKPAGRPVQ